MNPYFEQMVLGASPIELIRLLYQRGIRSVREAREHLAAGRIEERSNAITHTYAVIAELMLSLDYEAAPAMAARLRALYCYIQERLLEANLKQIDAPLAEVLGLMNTLSEAWSEVRAEVRSETKYSTPAPEPARQAGAWMTSEIVCDERMAFSA